MKKIHLKHFWIVLHDDEIEMFIDDLETLCDKYIENKQYHFLFSEEDND